MKVVTAEQIRDLDRRAMERGRMPGIVLMENAGRAVFEVIEREYGPLRGKKVVVCCGTGNNGGDGFVIARYLHLAGAHPIVLMTGSYEALRGDAKTHAEALLHSCHVVATDLSEDKNNAIRSIDLGDVIVDALLGTGIREAPRELYAECIRKMNESGRPIVSVDIPSGVDADSGKTPGAAVRADHTVTFAYPKLGLFLFPGAECAGRLHLSDIGFDWEDLKCDTPYELLAYPSFPVRAFRPSSIQAKPEESAQAGWRKLLKKRAPESNKGDYGHLGILAGSRGMAGAPALVARAAQRSGAGLVTVLTAGCVQPILASKLDEQMTLPLPDREGALTEEAFDAVATFAEKATALCIGPGLTTSPGTVALMHRILREIMIPIVLDADGLNALAQQPELLAQRPDDPRAPLILTPHPGEAARLLGISIPEVQADRIEAVRQLARRYRAISVLKGRYTLIADPSGPIAINTTGNPGMATGGMGDTLTGILGGLLAQGVAPGKSVPDLQDFRKVTAHPQEIAALGVHLHGMAGDLAAEEAGEAGLTAGDVIAHLTSARRLLEGELGDP
jgi:hydroxyethylthiazole kinase-like uncharacterized protein yjeF